MMGKKPPVTTEASHVELLRHDVKRLERNFNGLWDFIKKQGLESQAGAHLTSYQASHPIAVEE